MTFHACPCCGLPTLENAHGDTCPLCFWEDTEGANAPYSRVEAQANFADHRHMFGVDDAQAPRPGEMRRRLLAIAHATPFDAAAYRAWLGDWNDWSC